MVAEFPKSWRWVSGAPARFWIQPGESFLGGVATMRICFLRRTPRSPDSLRSDGNCA